MRTVHEVSTVTGVSVRTLHHYDAIGLLKPSKVTEAGYRLYDDKAMERLHAILMFRELQFPLKEIGRILDHPDFDRREALRQQIDLLRLQREHIDRLITAACEIMEKEGTEMNFSAFDKSEIENYAREAKERWGTTQTYQENQSREQGKTDAQRKEEGDGLMAVFAELGSICAKDPAAPEAQAWVQKLQAYITEHYYTCTPEILSGLGQMYVADERFRENIDRAGGQGTAVFAAEAIAVFSAR